MTIGEYISAYMRDHELSIRAFGRMCDLSPTYISNLISGRPDGSFPVPTISTLKSISSACGISLDDLMRLLEDLPEYQQGPAPYEPNPGRLSERETELILLFRHANPTEQQIILSMVRGAVKLPY